MANEKRLIDANALEELENLDYIYDPVRDGCAWYRAADVWTCLESQPTVDAVEVVHGRWDQVQRWATKAKYRCSVCGREIMSAVKVNIEKYPYCHCGAKMDGDGNV